MSPTERVLWAGGHGTVLAVVLAGIAFISGYWAILLALGPAAYLFALDAHSSDHTPTNIAISYTAALVSGWIAYTAIAQGITPTAIEPMSRLGLRIIGSALFAFTATSGVFYLLHTLQPMAYIAAFAAAIGVFPTLPSLVVAIITVLLMAGVQAVRRHYGPAFTDSSETTLDQHLGM